MSDLDNQLCDQIALLEGSNVKYLEHIFPVERYLTSFADFCLKSYQTISSMFKESPLA